jgi:hypothetical protein
MKRDMVIGRTRFAKLAKTICQLLGNSAVMLDRVFHQGRVVEKMMPLSLFDVKGMAGSKDI